MDAHGCRLYRGFSSLLIINYILFDPINEIVFPKKPYSMFPRPCRGGDRGGVSDIKEDRRAWKILCAGKNADPTPAPPELHPKS